MARRDLDATWAVVEPLLQPLVTPATAPVHPVRELHERCQRLGLPLKFRVVQPAQDSAAQKGALGPTHATTAMQAVADDYSDTAGRTAFMSCSTVSLARRGD